LCQSTPAPGTIHQLHNTTQYPTPEIAVSQNVILFLYLVMCKDILKGIPT